MGIVIKMPHTPSARISLIRP